MYENQLSNISTSTYFEPIRTGVYLQLLPFTYQKKQKAIRLFITINAAYRTSVHYQCLIVEAQII